MSSPARTTSPRSSVSSSILEIEDLRVDWVASPQGPITRRILDGIRLSVRPGQVVGLVGESGAGKSVTALSVERLLSAKSFRTSGCVRFEGEDLLQAPDEKLREIRGNRIGFVFQEPQSTFNPLVPIVDQVGEPLRVHRQASKEIAREAAKKLLERLGLFAASIQGLPHQLSGGMLQRAAIAMALICDPVLLVADEPTTALDAVTQADLLRLLADLASERKMALLLVTHDFRIVAKHCDRVAVFREGRIVEQGPTQDLLARPIDPYTQGLVKLAFPSSTGPAAPRRAVPTLDRDLLKVSDLTKVYSGLRAVDRVSFSLAAGKTLALVGESGSGKSTLAKSILRLVEPTSGSIVFAGEELIGLGAKPMRRLRRRMQYIFQDFGNAFDPKMTVEEVIAEPIRIHRLAGSKEIPSKVEALLDQVGLPPSFASRLPDQLSGGQRQRLGIARALAVLPELIVADEILSALDVTIQSQLVELLIRLQKELGLTYLFITHDLRTARLLAAEVAVMKSGQLVEIGPAEQVFSSPRHPYTQALLEAG